MTIEDPIIKQMDKQEIIQCLNEVRHPVDIAIYGTKNYFNMGAVIRLADNFLARRIIGIEIKDFYKKAAMTGLKWQKENIDLVSLQEFLDSAKNRNVVSFERRTSISMKDLRGYKYPSEPILVFGSEDFGVPDEILNISKDIVAIPMYGLIHDMNVGNACAVALYDFVNKHYGI